MPTPHHTSPFALTINPYHPPQPTIHTAWRVESPPTNPRDTDTHHPGPSQPAREPSPFDYESPTDRYSPLFRYVSPVDRSPSPPIWRRSPTPPPPPRPRPRRRNTRQHSPTRTPIRRRRSATPSTDLLQLVAATAPHDQRRVSSTAPWDEEEEEGVRVRVRSPSLDDSDSIMTRMPSPDFSWTTLPILNHRRRPSPGMERRTQALSSEETYNDLFSTYPEGPGRLPLPSMLGPMGVPDIGMSDGFFTRMPSPVPLDLTSELPVSIPQERRVTQWQDPRPPPWSDPGVLTWLSVASGHRRPTPKADPEPATKPEPEPEPEAEPEPTLQTTAALLETLAADLAAGASRAAWGRVERALTGLRALHLAGSSGAGARAGGGVGGECVICYERPADSVFRPCGHLVLCSECVVSERVGGGPAGKWPVVSCPVGRCGAVVEAAVKVFRG
ncbi:uncharacterized protein H6S33_007152 [Morchella sextelata]|uniref:uncharacterized protein n=1 Tax=Morchella sextelata TaxID=1174677 RepID=UPI001D03E3FA|nr:uncharacterized protein H6S33_007152 [Morchella sextelata]KAH0604121.1 hypothetical protein H6S33_007152 [Morchella sextelata]